MSREVDARADIYSLGAVLYTMLCDLAPCRQLTMDPTWLVSGRNCMVIEVQNVGGSRNGLEVSASARQLH